MGGGWRPLGPEGVNCARGRAMGRILQPTSGRKPVNELRAGATTTKHCSAPAGGARATAKPMRRRGDVDLGNGHVGCTCVRALPAALQFFPSAVREATLQQSVRASAIGEEGIMLGRRMGAWQ